MKHVFEKRYEFEGKTYTEIEFDLEGLKGSDISAAKKRFVREGGFSPMPTIDSDFCALLLAGLTKQPLEFFTGLPAREYCEITQKVSNFLMGSASE